LPPPDHEPADDLNSLHSALTRYAIEVDQRQISLLETYSRALWEWNEKINLTRHTDYDKFVSRDVVDSYWLERYLDSAEHVLDVGTGGGVPGVILAILRADLDVSICDSVAKKVRALDHIVNQLALPIRVYHARAEALLLDHMFDTLVLRAVAPLDKLLTWFRPRFSAFQRLLVIKGPAWTKELESARHRNLLRGLKVNTLASYSAPDGGHRSMIIEIRRDI